MEIKSDFIREVLHSKVFNDLLIFIKINLMISSKHLIVFKSGAQVVPVFHFLSDAIEGSRRASSESSQENRRIVSSLTPLGKRMYTAAPAVWVS